MVLTKAVTLRSLERLKLDSLSLKRNSSSFCIWWCCLSWPRSSIKKRGHTQWMRPRQEGRRRPSLRCDRILKHDSMFAQCARVQTPNGAAYAVVVYELILGLYLAVGYLNSSSWLPVRSKKATSLFDDQITSQSPELAIWHSLRPAQLPLKRCMLWRHLRISWDSEVFSSTRSMSLLSSSRFQLRRLAFFFRSRENAVENSEESLPSTPSLPR